MNVLPSAKPVGKEVGQPVEAVVGWEAFAAREEGSRHDVFTPCKASPMVGAGTRSLLKPGPPIARFADRSVSLSPTAAINAAARAAALSER